MKSHFFFWKKCDKIKRKVTRLGAEDTNGGMSMQKIFRKNAVMIVTIAILILFAGNSVVTLFSVKRQQYHTFSSKIDQIIQTMKNNDKEIEAINANGTAMKVGLYVRKPVVRMATLPSHF